MLDSRTSIVVHENGYEPFNPNHTLAELLDSMWNHAMVIWVFLPMFALVLWFVEPLRPTCEDGPSNWALLGVVVVIGSSIASESRAWAASKALLTRPERTIMQQLGVLQKRRRLVILGIIEGLDVHTDLMFPFVAHTCKVNLTDKWLHSWEVVPVVGTYAVKILERLRFWGFSLISISIICLASIVGIVRMKTFADNYQKLGIMGMHVASGRKPSNDSSCRLMGEEFFSLARFAECATMPSVAEICEEMAEQRRWVYDANEKHQGAQGAAKAREDFALGKATLRQIEEAELQDQEERERVDHAKQVYFIILLLGKTLVGNALQLWLQASFFELSFEGIGTQAQYKLLAGMAMTAVQVCVRCSDAMGKLGCLGVVFTAINLSVVAWAGAKIYFAYHCEGHIWNLSTGCVSEDWTQAR
mmetsp:Transcript_48246/g.121515  ORF Transcript_48246/g.121515 Transcript_48246/m.121515 type:complete len:416 (+) Transcript_48246:152-1399(+)